MTIKLHVDNYFNYQIDFMNFIQFVKIDNNDIHKNIIIIQYDKT